MKKIALLLFYLPFCVHAQFLPQLIPGYSSPADFNAPLDPAYVPGQLYRVDYYQLAVNQSDMFLAYHYLIETDASYKMLRQSRYIDDITEYTTSIKYVAEYAYSNNRLNQMHFSDQKIHTDVLVPSSTYSFQYENDLLSIRERWDIDPDSGTTKAGLGGKYNYDSLDRFIQYAPYNLDPEPGVTYTGYYTIDSFTVSGKPARMRPYTVPVDSNYINFSYTIIAYDSLDRVSYTTRYMFISDNQPYFRTDSSLCVYTGTRLYPDSIISYTATHTISGKKIFTYTSAGTIAEILSYRKQGTDFVLYNKEVYTALLHSSLQENSVPFTFAMYPNPSPGHFTIQVTDADHGEIVVSNMLGETIHKQYYTVAGQITITAELKPGIYTVSVSNGLGLVTRKLVVQ